MIPVRRRIESPVVKLSDKVSWLHTDEIAVELMLIFIFLVFALIEELLVFIGCLFYVTASHLRLVPARARAYRYRQVRRLRQEHLETMFDQFFRE